MSERKSQAVTRGGGHPLSLLQCTTIQELSPYLFQTSHVVKTEDFTYGSSAEKSRTSFFSWMSTKDSDTDKLGLILLRRTSNASMWSMIGHAVNLLSSHSVWCRLMVRDNNHQTWSFLPFGQFVYPASETQTLMLRFTLKSSGQRDRDFSLVLDETVFHKKKSSIVAIDNALQRSYCYYGNGLAHRWQREDHIAVREQVWDALKHQKTVVFQDNPKTAVIAVFTFGALQYFDTLSKQSCTRGKMYDIMPMALAFMNIFFRGMFKTKKLVLGKEGRIDFMDKPVSDDVALCTFEDSEDVIFSWSISGVHGKKWLHDFYRQKYLYTDYREEVTEILEDVVGKDVTPNRSLGSTSGSSGSSGKEVLPPKQGTIAYQLYKQAFLKEKTDTSSSSNGAPFCPGSTSSSPRSSSKEVPPPPKEGTIAYEVYKKAFLNGKSEPSSSSNEAPSAAAQKASQSGRPASCATSGSSTSSKRSRMNIPEEGTIAHDFYLRLLEKERNHRVAVADEMRARKLEGLVADVFSSWRQLKQEQQQRGVTGMSASPSDSAPSFSHESIPEAAQASVEEVMQLRQQKRKREDDGSQHKAKRLKYCVAQPVAPCNVVSRMQAPRPPPPTRTPMCKPFTNHFVLVPIPADDNRRPPLPVFTSPTMSFTNRFVQVPIPADDDW